MRIRHLVLASLLTVTFGCPGDDSGDTDANTTANTTENTTGEPPTNTTGEPPSDTTGEPPADTSTGTPGTDSSSGGDDTGSSSSGGMGNEACEQLCTTYFAACGESDANDYGDMGGCVEACADYDQTTLECKENHASMADGPDSVHCSHANQDGGGVC